MQCRFDTAPWGGVLVGNYSDLKKMTHSEREDSAREALDIYNSYFNGAVFEFSSLFIEPVRFRGIHALLGPRLQGSGGICCSSGGVRIDPRR